MLLSRREVFTTTSCLLDIMHVGCSEERKPPSFSIFIPKKKLLTPFGGITLLTSFNNLASRRHDSAIE
jgi:hypothetical protein